jgi:(p)ppGpp synthase/HD superfamily hydrolase
MPIATAAVEFAVERHAGQLRHVDRAPFVMHPIEVGSLLSSAGYADEVVAAGVLHDVLEDTDTSVRELEERFGTVVSALVSAVTEDASIEDERVRKRALRSQVARGPADAVAVFAADKVSKSRELRMTLSRDPVAQDVARKATHYWASLRLVERRLGRQNAVVRQLRLELEALAAAWPA